MSHLTASPEVYQYGSNKPYLMLLPRISTP